MLALFDTQTLVLIGFLTLITATLHGATGVAGGFLLSAAIAPIIGIAPLVPVISIALLISHSSRAILNFKDFERTSFLAISIPAIPCIVIFAFLYGRMASSTIALVLGLVILTSIPIRRWAKSRMLKTTKPILSAVGAVYGMLSGVALGPGMLLVPFMLGFGLTKEAFVATLAAIALLTNITRLAVYGASNLLSSDYFMLGIFIGLVTIPGNWLGRTFLRGMSNANHSSVVDVLTILGALNFFWLAYKSA
jgi:uncharacterized membrane protein YfcA